MPVIQPITTASGTSAFVPLIRTITINGVTQDLSVDRTFTVSGLSGLIATTPLSFNSGTSTISISQAGSSTNGFLSSTDWLTFSSKQNAITLTTTGNNGSATLVGATLNIPEYTLAGLGGMSNPMTSLGDMIRGNAVGLPIRLAGNTTTTKMYLSQTGDGTNSAAPVWSAITASDVGGVPTSRTLTINGTSFDLSANRSWTVGNVTGTGASGQIAYFTGTTAQSGSNNLFWDSGNTRLGIGTNTPATTLQVSGIARIGNGTATDGATTLEQTYSGDNVIGVISAYYSSGAMILGYGIKSKVGADAFISTFDNFTARRAALSINQGYFDFFNTASVNTAKGSDVAATSLMRLHTTGNLVIGGTTSNDSSEKLQVNGTAKISGEMRVAATMNSTQAIFANTTGRGLEISTSQISGTNEAGVIFNARSSVSSGTLIFQTDGIQRLLIDINGPLISGGNGLRFINSAANNVNAIRPTAGGTSVMSTNSNGLHIAVGTEAAGDLILASNNTERIRLSSSGWLSHTSATNPSSSVTDSYVQYSADVTAGNAAPHFRTENGAVIKLYQETTSVGNSIMSLGGGSAVLDDTTFDGYTLRQIVKALRNQGILA
jgi:hypothetical protein